MSLGVGDGSGITRLPPNSAKAGWVRHIERETRSSTAMWCSKVLPHEEDLSGFHSLTEVLHASI